MRAHGGEHGFVERQARGFFRGAGRLTIACHSHGNGRCSGCVGSERTRVGAERAAGAGRFGGGVAGGAGGGAIRGNLRGVCATHERHQNGRCIQVRHINPDGTAQHLGQRARIGDRADLAETQVQGFFASVVSIKNHFYRALQISAGGDA